MDADCLLSGAKAYKCLSRHQWNSAQSVVEVFSAAGRNCGQDPVWHGLAWAGRAGDQKEPGRFSSASTVGRSKSADPQQDGVGNLARLARRRTSGKFSARLLAIPLYGAL